MAQAAQCLNALSKITHFLELLFAMKQILSSATARFQTEEMPEFSFLITGKGSLLIVTLKVCPFSSNSSSTFSLLSAISNHLFLHLSIHLFFPFHHLRHHALQATACPASRCGRAVRRSSADAPSGGTRVMGFTSTAKVACIPFLKKILLFFVYFLLILFYLLFLLIYLFFFRDFILFYLLFFSYFSFNYLFTFF